MPQAAPLHLIPVGLSESPVSGWLPADVRALTRELTTFIAENAKTYPCRKSRFTHWISAVTNPVKCVTG